MSSENESILKDFQDESKTLLEEMTSILDECEEGPGNVARLEDYGLNVDRIMGGAKSVATLMDPPVPVLDQMGSYAAICKAVAYKASQIRNNDQFYSVCVAFLQDATEVLEDLLKSLSGGKGESFTFNKAFIERLKFVSNKFSDDYRATVGSTPAKLSTDEIDALLKKLGI